VHARAARLGDAEAVARIYNEGIEERIATFETRQREPGEVRGWLDNGYPIVVVEDGGTVISFANASAYGSRECYSGVAEFSVYTAGEARGRGAGALAMEALISTAERAGFWKLTSRVFVENGPSRELLLSLGFREVGVHEKHARLDGVWRDVVVVERLIPANL
jgi:phosphinothricin acetyltransferase